MHSANLSQTTVRPASFPQSEQRELQIKLGVATETVLAGLPNKIRFITAKGVELRDELLI